MPMLLRDLFHHGVLPVSRTVPTDSTLTSMTTPPAQALLPTLSILVSTQPTTNSVAVLHPDITLSVVKVPMTETVTELTLLEPSLAPVMVSLS